MFPLSDENPHFLTPYATYVLIALNALAWMFVQRFGTEMSVINLFDGKSRVFDHIG